jgi:transcriptional regulator with XRE-family HTH domain
MDRRVTGKPHPVDVYVGSRVRQRRTLLGLSQEKLGDAIGLTFQQVQKYERGANRIGASRLYELAQILDVPVAFFYEDLPQSMADMVVDSTTGAVEDAETYEQDPMAKRETLELVRAYYKVKDARVRRRLFDLTKALAAANGKKS